MILIRKCRFIRYVFLFFALAQPIYSSQRSTFMSPDWSETGIRIEPGTDRLQWRANIYNASSLWISLASSLKVEVSLLTKELWMQKQYLQRGVALLVSKFYYTHLPHSTLPPHLSAHKINNIKSSKRSFLLIILTSLSLFFKSNKHARFQQAFSETSIQFWKLKTFPNENIIIKINFLFVV